MEICTKLFVYGTLQEGHGNSRLLSSSTKVGPAVTKEKYVLGTVGFPYLFSSDDFPADMYHPVAGELWELDSEETLRRIDSLEGHPHHYQREVIELADGTEAWAYMQKNSHAAHYCYQCRVNEEGNYEW